MVYNMFNYRRLKNISSIVLTAALVLGFSQTTFAASPKNTFKCWTNKEGVRECGNAVPPEYAQQGHVEMNEKGMVVDKVERAKTRTELEEEARLKIIEDEKKKQVEEQARLDRALLSTYSNTDDMIMARDGKIRAIDATIKLANDKIVALTDALNVLKKQAADTERAGKPLPKQLQEDMELTQGKIDRQQQLITDKKQEQQDINAQTERDIQRFQELKGVAAPN